ncbi:hypothetical protein N0V88_001752 [Collariella sp. IMI 366227]|nr:hypothetical protein N0V88_001752 [Collariella sp. IMI 366227]
MAAGLAENDIDHYALHCAALPLAFSQSGAIPERLGLQMLMILVEMGYTPSILTVVDLVLRSSGDSVTQEGGAFHDALVRFKRLAEAGNNPQIMTLHGLLLMRQGRSDISALRSFDKAIEAGRFLRSIPDTRPRSGMKRSDTSTIRLPKWRHEGHCHVKRGELLVKLGRAKEAMAAFKIAAFELDLGDGYFGMAKLLPPEAPERETYLLQAAQSVLPTFEACNILALNMANKAANRSLSQEDRIFHANQAYEWAQMELDPVKRRGVMAQVYEKVRDVTGQMSRKWVERWMATRHA